MEKQKSINSSSSSSANKISFNPRKGGGVVNDDDGYSSSSESDTYSQDEAAENQHIDIQKFLPPANPLQPKVFQEDFNVYTATNSKFEKLPNFNKNKNFSFMEPSIKPVQLQEYMAKCTTTITTTTAATTKTRNNSTEQDPQQAENNTGATSAALAVNANDGRLRLLSDLHKLNKDKLVYKKYNDIDLNEPTQINGVVYFATYLSHLKNLMKNRQEEDQLPPSSTFKSSEKKKPSLTRKSSKSETQLNVPGNTELSSISKPQIQFSSNFESGNLFCAYEVAEGEYDLVLQNDVNTKGNTQWFFFMIKNAQARSVIKFNILNCIKPGSLFNDGLCPCVFSVKQNEIDGQEWIRDGFNIKYFKSNIQRDGNKGKPHYTLTFSYYVHHAADTIYFAHSYPYTFTDHKEYINNIMKSPENHNMLSVKRLCKTIAGNICEQLTITSSSMNKRNQRKGIVIFARQHPGETGGSYMMQGCIDFLLSDAPEAQYLREACVFKIVPMLNPDGVIHGNYRCSLAGCDLNRRWKKPRKKLHPTVFALKEMIKNFSREREIRLVVDLHGHSRKMNTFFYGCSYREDPVLARVFPFLMSKLTESIRFEDCRFGVQKSKEKTARISLWKELRITNVFTLEASFFGNRKNNQNSHYSIADLLDIGKNLVVNLYNLLIEEDESASAKQQQTRVPHLAQTKQIIMAQLKENEGKEAKSESDGSDSDPSEDELPDDQIIKLLPKSVLTNRQKQLLAAEEERAKERREKELKAKLLAKKNELLQGSNSDTQQVEKKRFTISKVFPRKLVIEKKVEQTKNDNKPNMVDASVQTDASFIMDMKAYLLKKQSLQNGFGSLATGGSSNNFSTSLPKSLSQTIQITGKVQPGMKSNFDQATLQGRASASSFIGNQMMMRKENQMQQLPTAQQLMSSHLRKYNSPVGHANMNNAAPSNLTNSNSSRNIVTNFNTRQAENYQSSGMEIVQPSGGSTLRGQNDPRQMGQTGDMTSPKTNLQDENIRSKLYSTAKGNAIVHDSFDSSRIINQQMGSKNREDTDSANTRTPLLQNRPQSIESGFKGHSKSQKGMNLPNSNNSSNLPILAASAQKGQQQVSQQLASTLGSPKADLNIFKKSKSQGIQILRSNKTILMTQGNDNNSIRKSKQFN